MKHIIALPKIGKGIVKGKVIAWLKQVGDPVAQSEPVVSVMADKSKIELPSSLAGILVEQSCREGETAWVDAPLYVIENKGEEYKAIEQYSPGKKVEAVPFARKLARKLGVDINQASGTGKKGRVTVGDVVKFHAAQKPNSGSSAPAPHMEVERKISITGVMHIASDKRVEPKYIIPHLSYFDQADAVRLAQLCAQVKRQPAQEGFHAAYMPFFIKALSQTIKKHPIANSSCVSDNNTLAVHRRQNIGIAESTQSGRIVCVLKDVQDIKLEEVVKAYDGLMRKASEGRLAHEEMSGSTITISNFGTLGGMWATPIINYPEAAILGIARIFDQPAVKDGQLVASDTANLSWSFDHRLIDGNAAAAISNTFIRLIENPAEIF